jgi:hypothetical protein
VHCLGAARHFEDWEEIIENYENTENIKDAVENKMNE